MVDRVEQSSLRCSRMQHLAAVPAAELRFASGIQEFARRVRELREEGYDIRSTGDGYLLERVPDN